MRDVAANGLHASTTVLSQGRYRDQPAVHTHNRIYNQQSAMGVGRRFGETPNQHQMREIPHPMMGKKGWTRLCHAGTIGDTGITAGCSGNSRLTFTPLFHTFHVRQHCFTSSVGSLSRTTVGLFARVFRIQHDWRPPRARFGSCVRGPHRVGALRYFSSLCLSQQWRDSVCQWCETVLTHME